MHAASMRINRTWVEDSGHHQRASAATKEPVRVLLSHGQEAPGGKRGRIVDAARSIAVTLESRVVLEKVLYRRLFAVARFI